MARFSDTGSDSFLSLRGECVLTESLARPVRQRRVPPRRTGLLQLEAQLPALARGCAPKSEAVALLSQVVARLHGLEVPVVQFIQVSGDLKPSNVPRDFAEACLSQLGRTLLAGLHNPRPAQAGSSASTLARTIHGRRRAKKLEPEWPEIVPDVGVQGLYHVRIGAGPGELNQVQPSVWLGEARLDFRFLVIDCGPLDRNPAAVELASRCHGSILTVAAGVTRLAQVQAVAQHVQVAGGTLLGSVLYDVSTGPQLATFGLRRRLSRLRGLP